MHVRKDFFDMLKSQMWQNRWSGASVLGDFVHTVYIYRYIYIYIYIYIYTYIYLFVLFRFDTSPEKLFVSCHYHALFVCLEVMVCKVNTANIHFFRVYLDIQIYKI